MRIVVNTRLLLKDKLEGIGWFEYETLKRLTVQHKDCEFIFAFDRKFDESFIFSDNITPEVVNPQARHPFLYYVWFEHSIPSLLKKFKPDLFYSPDGYLSLNTDVKSVNVIHDLNFEHFPEHLPLLARKYYRYYFQKFAHKASRILTVSEFSKKDIAETYKISPEKIDVVYNGVNEYFLPIDEGKKIQTMEKYSQSKPYFVFVGSLHNRKNLSGLFEAFDLFRKQTQDFKLIVVGEKRWWTGDIENAYDMLKYKEDVVFTGRVSTEEMNNLIASAEALVLPSFFEGFGVPIIEAFNCGTPVITSNVTSMPEIAGDAALLIDPYSVESICDAMTKLTNDEKLKQVLIQKGNIRKKLYSWQQSSDKIWESFLKVI